MRGQNVPSTQSQFNHPFPCLFLHLLLYSTLNLPSARPGADGEGEEDPDRRQEQTDRALHHGSTDASVQGKTCSLRAAGKREAGDADERAGRVTDLSVEIIDQGVIERMPLWTSVLDKYLKCNRPFY